MRRPGGMFGGLFGGLLVGGLLGSLFFGGHFMGPNLLDLLIIGGLLYLAFRFFRSRRPQEQRNTPGASAAETHTRGHHGWDTLRSSAGATSAASEGDGKSRPDGFDEQEFLAGAKAAFVRLQQSWDERDLDDIAQFTAPEVLQTIREQAELDSQPGKTDILVLDAELLDVRQLGSQTVADVEFTARMQEDGEVKNVREVWHFSRYDHDPQSGWILEGLQQVH